MNNHTGYFIYEADAHRCYTRNINQIIKKGEHIRNSRQKSDFCNFYIDLWKNDINFLKTTLGLLYYSHWRRTDLEQRRIAKIPSPPTWLCQGTVLLLQRWVVTISIIRKMLATRKPSRSTQAIEESGLDLVVSQSIWKI